MRETALPRETMLDWRSKSLMLQARQLSPLPFDEWQLVWVRRGG
jgi:hypothetical protein